MNTRTASDHHGAFEQYCEAIFELHEDDLDVIQARIADRLDVSRPAVSEMIKRMEADGLVLLGTNITLTSKGTELAEQIVRRHRLAERFLTDVLKLSWADAIFTPIGGRRSTTSRPPTFKRYVRLEYPRGN